MADPKDTRREFERLVLKLERQVRELRKTLYGDGGEARGEAIDILRQLGYSAREAKAFVENTPPGLDAEGIVREVFERGHAAQLRSR